MRHFGGGVGHIKNTVVPSVDTASNMDEEEVIGGSTNAPDSDLPLVDVEMRTELGADEMDEEMDEAENDEDLEDLDLDDDEELANDEEAVGSDDDGYASL